MPQAIRISLTAHGILLFIIWNLQNHFRRTFLRAFSAAGALGVINHRHIVVHVDGIKFTLLGAESTSNAAYLAFSFNVFALIMRSTLYQMLRAVRHQINKMSWTGCHTFAAGHTFFFVHLGNAVDDMNSVKLTGCHAAAKSHTAVAAGLGAGARITDALEQSAIPVYSY